MGNPDSILKFPSSTSRLSFIHFIRASSCPINLPAFISSDLDIVDAPHTNVDDSRSLLITGLRGRASKIIGLRKEFLMDTTGCGNEVPPPPPFQKRAG